MDCLFKGTNCRACIIDCDEKASIGVIRDKEGEMLYCKWAGVMCRWVDRETGVCGAPGGECEMEDT